MVNNFKIEQYDHFKNAFQKYCKPKEFPPKSEAEAVHIITPSLHPRDAVSRHVLEMSAFLDLMGFKARIYADQIAPELDDIVRPSERLFVDTAPGDKIIYHFSIGHELFNKISLLKNKKALYYHGITPPELLGEEASPTAKLCSYGLQQFGNVSQFDLLAANSMFNAEQIQQLGNVDRASIHWLPPFLSLEKWNSIDSDREPAWIKESEDEFNLLYVGRMFPHKNIHGLLELFNELVQRNSNLKLNFVGSLSAGHYLNHINRYIESNNLGAKVRFITNAPDSQLKWCYENADALITLSQHEGFAIPIAEAMLFKLPIISHHKSAITETLSGSGLILDDKLANNIEKASSLVRSGGKDLTDQQTMIFNKRYSDASNFNRYFDFLSLLMR